MNVSNVRIYFAAAMLAAACLSASVTNAQGGPTGATRSVMDNPLTRSDSTRASDQIETAYLRQTLGDPKEEAAYQAFHKVGMQDADKKIKLGQAFIAKYPGDRYSEVVYLELTQTYYAKHDLANFYAYSDKALSLFPDDVPVLALTGWVIPRAFDRNDPGADKSLDKAETYEKHVIDVVGKMSKPDNLTDQQFAEFKTGELAVAHSGLGLIYFRREQYETSAKELQDATATEANPDPSDLFVLGADLENEGRFKDAADAFNHCAQLGGSMQDNCKQQAANAMKQVGDTK